MNAHDPVVTPGDGAPPYTVHIGAGLLEQAHRLLETEVRAHRYVIVTDENVARLHGHAFRERLHGAGVPVGLIEVAAGEASKTRQVWSVVTDRMLEAGVGRDGCVLAVGGGVIGDLAGFVAATYMRGIPVVQIPTTLMAMIDASLGGKTAIDVPAGKNLVGAFHHPRAVLADPHVLTTLPDAQFRAGLAEAVKHGAIADADYLTWLSDAAPAILARTDAVVERLVRTSIEIKARIVSADARESGVRAILNFGHTVGHAVERLTDWRTPHGHAVAIGMVVEARLGERLGLTEPGTAATLERLCLRFGLPAGLPHGISMAAVADATLSDKKGRRGVTRFALIRRPGAALQVEQQWTIAVGRERFIEALSP